MIKRIIVVFLIAGILIISSVTSAAGTDALVKVVPASIDASVGDTFTVEVVVDPAGADVYGVQYDLVFDPAVLEAVSQDEGDLLNQNGAKTFEAANTIKNEDGLLEYGVSRMQVGEGVKDSGTLATITFRVVGKGGSKLELDNVKLSNPHAEVIPSNVESGICTVDGVMPTSTLTPAETSTPVHTEEPESTPAATTTPNTPGFGVVIAGIGIMMIAYAFKRRI